MKILTMSSGIFVLIVSPKYLKIFKIFQMEYPILILCSILGMMVMISSNDLIVFFIALELQSLALYILASFNRDQIKSSEAGLKYFILSALSSGLLLYGCSLIYGFSGSTNFIIISETMNSSQYGLTFGFIFILVGLAFKISAVPFHMWAPDVYEGSPTSVTLFFAIVPKIAALTVFIRFLYLPFLNVIDQWQIIIVFLSIASMVFGAVAAIGHYGFVSMHDGAIKDHAKLKEIGDSVHERLAEFPFWSDYDELIKSDIADIKNLGGPYGGAISAGKFLAHFADYPFIHIDLPGVYSKSKYGYRGKGATGMGVRLLYQFIKNRA